MVESHSESRLHFAQTVGLDHKSLTEAVSSTQPILSYLCAEKLGNKFAIPYGDFYPVDDSQDDRIRNLGLTPPPANEQWANGSNGFHFGVEEGVSDALEQGQRVALWGKGRCGKSSISLAIARHLGGRFPRGVIWIDCANGESARMARRDISAALRFRLLAHADSYDAEDSSEVSPEEFGRYFWARKRLLIMDNVPSADFVEDMCGLQALHSSPRRDHTPLLIVTESEQVATRLHLHGHFSRFDVPPLPAKAVRAVLLNTLAEQRAASDCAPVTTGFDKVAQAIDGRPDALALANDLLSRKSFSLDDVCTVLKLQGIGTKARQAFQALRVFDGNRFPADWARAVVPELSDECFASTMDALVSAGLLIAGSDSSLGIAPAAASEPAVSFFPADLAVLDVARHHMVRHAGLTIERIAHDRGASRQTLLRFPELWSHCLSAMVSSLGVVDPKARNGGALATRDNTTVGLLVLWRHALARCSMPEVENWFTRGIAAATALGRPLAQAQLLAAFARWRLLERANFAELMELLEQAADLAVQLQSRSTGEDYRAACLVASHCDVELGRGSFAVGRAHLGADLFARSLDQAKLADAPPTLIGLRMNAVALSYTRQSEPEALPSKERVYGWHAASECLQDALDLLKQSESPCTHCLRDVLGYNLAVVRFFAGNRKDMKVVTCALQRLLVSGPPEWINASLFTTACSLGVDLLGEGLKRQEEHCRKLWKDSLNCAAEDVREVGFLYWKQLFYLVCVHQRPGDGPLSVCEETGINEHNLGIYAACSHTEACFRLDVPSALLSIYDDEMLQQIETFYLERAPQGNHGLGLVQRYRAMWNRQQTHT